jgi:hypothetical protein
LKSYAIQRRDSSVKSFSYIMNCDFTFWFWSYTTKIWIFLQNPYYRWLPIWFNCFPTVGNHF